MNQNTSLKLLETIFRSPESANMGPDEMNCSIFGPSIRHDGSAESDIRPLNNSVFNDFANENINQRLLGEPTPDKDWTGMEDFFDVSECQQQKSASPTNDPNTDEYSHINKDQDFTAPSNVTSEVDGSDPSCSPMTTPSDECATLVDDKGSATEDSDHVHDLSGDGAPDDVPKWRLRPQNREQGAFPSTWMDKDETGDYDPTEEQRQLRLKRRRTKGPVKIRCPFESDDETEKETKKPRLELPSLEVSWKFKADEVKANFAHLVQNWSSAQGQTRNEGYQLRKRNSTIGMHGYTTLGLEYKLDLPENLTGWPIARGCHDCAAFGHRCSLLDDERSWPCRICTEESWECCLITPPTRKLSCTACKESRQSCTYASTRNQGKSCFKCTQHGLRCVAGPVKEAIRPRLRYSRDWGKDPPQKPRSGKERSGDHCLECREAGKPCFFEADSDFYDQCKSCATAGLPCTIIQTFDGRAQPAPKAMSTAEKGCLTPENGTTPEPSPKENPPTAPPLQIRPVSVSKSTPTIHTNFCHPIEFNYVDNSNGQNPCHFCDAPVLAVIGLGKRHVEVVPTSDGAAYKEVKGGHAAEGVANTKLCIACTTRRLPVVLCENHELREMPSSKGVRQSDQEEAMVALLQGEAVDLDRYCSLCANLALFECSTLQESGVDESNSAGVRIEGCGLKLCKPCKVDLEGCHNGDLSAMLAEIKDERSDYRLLGFRADHELLKADGPFVKYLTWLSRQ